MGMFKELTWVCFKELTWVCFKELTWVCLTYYVLMLKKQSMRHIFFIDAEKTIYFHTLFSIFYKNKSHISYVCQIGQMCYISQ